MSYLELKYLVPPEKIEVVEQWLDSCFANSDPYSAGLVLSLYFDTLSEESFRQCAEGAYFKCKYRLRSYDGVQFSTFQIKRKAGQQVFKQAFPVAIANGENVEKDFLDLQDSHLELHGAGILRPKFFIRYTRNRYRSQGFRFTLDHDISFSSCIVNPSYLRQEARLPFSVLELKTEDPKIIPTEISNWGLEYSSFSKFLFGEGLLRGREDLLAKFLQ